MLTIETYFEHIFNFEHISHIFLVFLFSTLDKWMLAGWFLDLVFIQALSHGSMLPQKLNLNPLQANVPFLCPLKRSENLCFLHF